MSNVRCARRWVRSFRSSRPWLELLEDRTLLNARLPLADFRELRLDTGSYESDTILVRFNPAADDAMPAGLELGREFSLVPGLHEVHLPAGMSVEDALAALQGDRDVLFAQPNYRVYVSLTPNDSLYSQQYPLNNTGQTGGSADADVDAAEAWNTF